MLACETAKVKGHRVTVTFIAKSLAEKSKGVMMLNLCNDFQNKINIDFAMVEFIADSFSHKEIYKLFDIKLLIPYSYSAGR